MSLILLDWNIEWNGGTENGLIHVVTPNLCNWHCSNLFDLATMSLGSYMYHNGCISKSNVACRDLPCLIISLSENGAFPTIGSPGPILCY